MTDQEINQAIAEACGWTEIKRVPFIDSLKLHFMRWFGISPKTKQEEPLPDYCHDLNAMHEAESFVDGDDYFAVLEDLVQGAMLADPDWPEGGDLYYWIARATARQRAKAFLRAIGKWREDQ